MRFLLLLSLHAIAKPAEPDPRECEVCVSNLEQIDALIPVAADKRKQPAIEKAIRKHCGDLQNQKPNQELSPKDKKMCYYFEPIKKSISQPFSTGMPKLKVCKRLMKTNPEICEAKYPLKVNKETITEEELSKMRVKQLKELLANRGISCDGCLEKSDFVKRVLATAHVEEL